MYGDIANTSWWGDEVTPKDFKADLDALGDIDELYVHINSGGGDVFAGWAIISIMQQHRARKVGFNDGLAASIAFEILMSMDEVVAMENSMFMCHNCWSFAIGNRHELRKQADMMEKIDGMMCDLTAKRSGKTAEDVMALQDAESWFTAAEAVAEGFADKVENGKTIAASVDGAFLVMGKERFDMSRYKNMPTLTSAYAPLVCMHFDTDGDTQCEESLPYNGGESQPVKDTPRAIQPDRLAQQRADFKRIREKLLGG